MESQLPLGEFAPVESAKAGLATAYSPIWLPELDLTDLLSWQLDQRRALSLPAGMTALVQWALLQGTRVVKLILQGLHRIALLTVKNWEQGQVL